MAATLPVVLVLTNCHDATATFLLDRAETADAKFVRLDTDDLQALKFHTSIPQDPRRGSCLAEHSVQNIGAVYYRRPVPPEIRGDSGSMARWTRAELRAAWGGALASIPEEAWLDHPLTISRASYKLNQLNRASELGLRVPDTVATNDPACAREFCDAHAWNVVAKPISSGSIPEDLTETSGLIYTNSLPASFSEHIELVANCPTLLQAAVDKVADVRVTIVGDEVFAVNLHPRDGYENQVDCRRDNMANVEYEATTLPPELTNALMLLMRSYGLRFSAIDLAVDKSGQHWFLEVNPVGQWAWLEQEIGIPICRSIVRLLVHIAHTTPRRTP